MFYYLIKGTSPEEKKAYMLGDPIEKFRYLNQSTVYDIRGVSDEKKFQEVQAEFSLYFSKEETHCIFKIIAIVLNVGNLLFKKELNKSNEEMAVIVNKEYLMSVAKLLQVDYEPF